MVKKEEPLKFRHELKHYINMADYLSITENINKIIIGVVIVAVIFTGTFLLNPEALGIQAQSTEPQYADKLFPEDEIITIETAADPEQWDEMIENATEEEYIPCDITINGETYYSVGIRPKGNSSLSMVANDENTDRFSFKIKMDEYVDDQNYYGLSKFVVNNMQGDATYMKEHLSYDLFESLGIDTPLYAFADISVNDEAWGFYLAIEAVEEEFAQRTYGSDYGMLYKPESQDIGGGGKKQGAEGQGGPENTCGGGIGVDGQRPEMPGSISGGGIGVDGQRPDRSDRSEGVTSGGINEKERMNGGFGGGGADASSGADLVYTDDEIDSYPQIFDNAVFDASETDKNQIIAALKALSTGEDLDEYVDVDEVLRYFAANTALVNLDSYICSFQHNYYLYEEDGRISILPWDLNLSFGGFQAKDATAAVNFPIDTPVTGVELSDRPLIGSLLENEEYEELYHSYLQTLVEEYFSSGRFEETIDRLDTLIGEHVKNDPSAFYTYDQYQAALETLKTFGSLRAQSIKGQLDGTVPSTLEGQAEEPAQLIDASDITISTMGSQGNGEALTKGIPLKRRPLFRTRD